MNAPYDLLVLWDWEHDTDFVALLQQACLSKNLRVRCMREAEIKTQLPQLLASKTLQAQCVLDRVWDWGGDWEQHVPSVKQYVPHRINEFEWVRKIWRKPYTHFQLIARGLHAPHMLVLPPVSVDAAPSEPDLRLLGKTFSVKGAHSGGSGVLSPASTWAEVLTRRQEWANDETVIQAWVHPQMLSHNDCARPAWFRAFYACGSVFLLWQDDRTHLQTPVTPEQEAQLGLSPLRGIVQHIATICGLNMFSTEIALDENGVWQVVDYVNDPCDFRLQSKAPECVPDETVNAICQRLASWVSRRRKV